MNSYQSYVKKFIHIDMDCFFAAVEIRENPALTYLPVAVGGLAEHHGVLSTCNYIAREFGLHSAMPTKLALLKCPKLVLIRPRMTLYSQVSAQIQEIFHHYTDLIEPISLDEAYLDVTHCQLLNGSATWIAQDIREKIKHQLNLTASAGVAPLKFLAKIGSAMHKPDSQYVITPKEVANFIAQLSLQKIPGIGKVTYQKLSQLQLYTCEDIQQFDLNQLIHLFGKQGQIIWNYSHGIDQRNVEANRTRKSLGVETTFIELINTLPQAQRELARLYDELLNRINKRLDFDKIFLQKIGVKIKLENYQKRSIEKSISNLEFTSFCDLLTEIWQSHQIQALRLLGIQVKFGYYADYPNQAILWQDSAQTNC